MAGPSIRSVIDDERWAFVFPLLPMQRRHTDPGPRVVFTAVVHAITTDTAWRHIPDVFGVSAAAARRRFWRFTDADLWRTLTAAATGTPHAGWARSLADAATYRARHRPVHGYQPIDERPAGATDTEASAADLATGEAARPRRYLRYSAYDYARARHALDQDDGSV